MSRMPRPSDKEAKSSQFKATHEELCNQAMAHYSSLSSRCGELNIVVLKAIAFYKFFGKLDLREISKRIVTKTRQGMRGEG